MEKTATLNLRVSPSVKQEAENVLAQLGIPMSTAVTVFLKQVALTGSIPFSVQLPKAPAELDVANMTDEQLLAHLQRRIDAASSQSAIPLEEAVARIEAL